MKTRKRKYKWGTLYLCTQMDQAATPIYYSTDGEFFDATVFQVADARHDWRKAFSLVNSWLAGQ